MLFRHTTQKTCRFVHDDFSSHMEVIVLERKNLRAPRHFFESSDHEVTYVNYVRVSRERVHTTHDTVQVTFSVRTGSGGSVKNGTKSPRCGIYMLKSLHHTSGTV